MATFDYSVSGKSGIANSLSACANRLLADHTIALRYGSQTAAAILPWSAVAYLGSEPPLGKNGFAEDATRLLCAPIMPASGPSVKPHG